MLCACGVENSTNAKFCKGCGSTFHIKSNQGQDVSKPCPICQATLKPDAKFCGNCGHKFVVTNVETVLATESTPLDQSARSLQAIKPNSTTEILKEKYVTGAIEANRSTSLPIPSNASTFSGVNKKTIIITALALSLIAGAALAWFSLSKDTTTPIPKSDNATPLSATTKGTELNLAQNPISTPVPAAAAISAKAVPSLASKYIGMTVKDGSKLGQYNVVLVGQSGGFKVLSAYEDDEAGMLSYTKIVLITDQSGKVFDSKDVEESGKVLVDGKSACVINQKPYVGVYALSSMEGKLTTPAAVWVLNDSGKLVNQDVNGVKCGLYVEFMPETDLIKAITGYNDLPKKAAQAQPDINNKPIKREQKATIVTTKKPTLQKNVLEAISTVEPQQEQQVNTQPQEPANQDEPQQKQINSLGTLFEKLGESVKKGSTEHVCSSAERAMGQCN